MSRFWGIGARYDDKDVVKDFINNGVACVGWAEEEAITLHQMLKQIKNGDIIYIKSHTPSNGLYIKAVGVVTDDEYKDRGYGMGVGVDWKWPKSYVPKSTWEKLGKVDDKYNVRSITLYEEFHPDIMDSLSDKIK